MFDGIYAREFYLNKIRGFYRDDMIKVVTGVRRCGNSSFIKSVANDLEASGVPAENIIHMDLDAKPYLKITTPPETPLSTTSSPLPERHPSLRGAALAAPP